ncbi:hypothetical protein [Aliikangiella sp. IMCC44632]
MLKDLIANIKVSLIMQILSILIGVTRAVIIPVSLSVIAFGYWQYYLLFVGFIGLLSCGFIDGFHLKYGGYKISALDWPLTRSSLIIYCCLIVLFAICIHCLSQYFISDIQKLKIFNIISLVVVVYGVNLALLNILVTTGEIKSYSFLNAIEKIILLFLLVIMIFIDELSLDNLLFADLISRVFQLTLIIYFMRQHLFGTFSFLIRGFNLFLSNLATGFSLLLANLASMLVLNASRLWVEFRFDMEQFSNFSFGLTITNLILLTITSVSVVLYPSLKAMEGSVYSKFYGKSTQIIQMLSIISLFSYFPILYFIQEYMIEYQYISKYLNMMLVLTLLQVRTQLLFITYFKVLRLELTMLLINIISLLFLASGIYALNLTDSGVSEIVSLLVVLNMLKVIVSGVLLSKHLCLDVKLADYYDLIFYVAFIFVTFYASVLVSAILVVFYIAIYCFARRYEILSLISSSRSFI